MSLTKSRYCGRLTKRTLAVLSAAIVGTCGVHAKRQPMFSSSGLFEVNVGLNDVDGIIAAFGDFNGDKMYVLLFPQSWILAPSLTENNMVK